MHNRFFEDQLEYFLLSQFVLLDVPCDIMKSTINRISNYPQYDLDTLMPPPDGWRILEPLCYTHTGIKLNEIYGLQLGALDLRLNTHIFECDIPARINRGQIATVSAKVKGTTNNAFLELRITDPANNRLVYPDPITWDSSTDSGTLNLKHEEYSSKWSFTIPVDSRLGEYKALIILYEIENLDKDTIERLKVEIDGIAEKNKHVLDFHEMSFTVAT